MSETTVGSEPVKPKPRTLKCPKGHTWQTYKIEWYFLEFKDAAGQAFVHLRSCPVCFVQWVKKQVPDLE